MRDNHVARLRRVLEDLVAALGLAVGPAVALEPLDDHRAVYVCSITHCALAAVASGLAVLRGRDSMGTTGPGRRAETRPGRKGEGKGDALACGFLSRTAGVVRSG